MNWQLVWTCQRPVGSPTQLVVASQPPAAPSPLQPAIPTATASGATINTACTATKMGLFIAEKLRGKDGRKRARSVRQLVAHPVPEQRHDSPVLGVAVVLVVRDAEDDGVVRRATVERHALRARRRSYALGHHVRGGRGRIERVTRGRRAAVLRQNARASREDAR